MFKSLRGRGIEEKKLNNTSTSTLEEATKIMKIIVTMLTSKTGQYIRNL